MGITVDENPDLWNGKLVHVILRCMANQKSVAASANADDLLFVPAVSGSV